jgi:hypothetical protein
MASNAVGTSAGHSAPVSPSEEARASSKEASPLDGLLVALKNLFVQIHKTSRVSKSAAISPKDLLRIIRDLNEMFRAPTHHDAHELLIFLLNAIGDGLLDRERQLIDFKAAIKMSRPGSPTLMMDGLHLDAADESPLVFRSDSLESLQEAATVDHTPDIDDGLIAFSSKKKRRKNTWIHDLFEGKLATHTTCLTCDTVR